MDLLLATTVTRRTALTDIVHEFWPVLAAAFVVSLVATPICRRIAMKFRIVDRPDDFLKPHKRPIPYLGGVAIFLGWFVGIGVSLLAQGRSPDGYRIDVPVMIGVALAGLAIMAVGLFDDMRVMKPRPKLIANIAVAVLLILIGIGDDLTPVLTTAMGVQFAPSEHWLKLLYSIPITLLVVVGACNATNLIDGLDGLCTGVLGIISAGYFILAVYLRQYTDEPIANERIVLALAMLGGAAGFLPFNRNPAKIFMGDAGSMLLGLNAAILMLLFSQDQLNWIIGGFMVFGLPVGDMLLTLARRWRNGRPLMQGDRSHFYDQLIDRGLGVRRVVAISYLLTTAFVLVGVSVIFLRIRHAILVYAVALCMAVFAVWKLNMAGIERDLRGADKTENPPHPSAKG